MGMKRSTPCFVKINDGVVISGRSARSLASRKISWKCSLLNHNEIVRFPKVQMQLLLAAISLAPCLLESLSALDGGCYDADLCSSVD